MRPVPLLEIDPDKLARTFDWVLWQRIIEQHTIVIERPYRSRHPQFQEIVYPLDYGYVERTEGTDGHEVDVFVGSASNGLIGLVATSDHRRGDREVKLLWNCTPEEIYCAHGFLNFDRSLMEGTLVLRRPMQEIWGSGAAAPRREKD